MKRISKMWARGTWVAVAVTAALSACSSTPKTIDELETARAIVPQVEASPRAGVAAENVSNARKSLQTANQLAEKGGKLDDIRYHAIVAATNAQIANEKILEAQARDEIAKGEVERQQVVLQARNREAEAARIRSEEARMRADSLEQELKDLKAKKTERGLVLTLGDVLFDTGKASLKPGAYATIDRLANALKEDPARKVMIEGHTDSVGSDEYNQTLSENRAQSVQSALMQRGVQSDQITALGKGESTPVASNDNAGGRQQNRRVELIFTEDPSRQQVATD
jgi:outer membrane protein OmpA-like peptidoglycan-associated protein